HTARARAPLAAWLQTRAAFACFLAQGYPALVAAAAVLGASAKWRGAARPGAATAAAAVSFALVTAAHFAVPFPYADYNTPAMPLAAALLAAALARKVSSAAPDAVRPVPVIAATLVAAVAFVAASPWPMKWVGGRQDRFWFSTDSSSAVARLRQAGKAVREANAGGKPLLVQDAYIAVEAGAPVLPGLEMGPFSVFPGLSDDEARRRRVHTPQTLLNAVRGADCDVATIGGYTFALECPSTNPLDEALREDLLAAVRERYPLETMRFDRFGQQDTALEVRTRRGARQSGE
ncbi:MAG: hypothetical protein IJS46_00900, partial [Kiritimatiellae bacterium]|nr:hypothetical protein [Kiritimatiellia bacterium]